ncbi:acetate kinase [Roseisolibacter sp. H3M3-2]|uniref:acetate/propionate family kinase n=1 Tax=Roseisolibacter sp. H3M3-2 TaxID=3031323 RepID=UPI0023DAF670|nr:acetate kinase [Roseisolibacter sp. H3M3-2]MDF1502080.1 acetate kinase [Roseisolibacter sp. H3M3-2]
MNVLVLNAGSSTLKFQLVRTDHERLSANTDEKLARGTIERLGGEAVLTLRAGDGPTTRTTASLRDHRAAVEWILAWLVSAESGVSLGGRADIEAVGHRVVHGGEQFTRSVRIDDAVLRGIEDTIDLAPLHNPANLRGIRAAAAVLGAGVPQVAVFDTAFHNTLPPHAYLYAIPYQLYRRYKVRRYGFHGTSHRYVAHRWRQLTGTAREATRLVTLHLGNGCSACAIAGGDSVDTSMGFTPLEGLVMGTRSGDVDATILDYVGAKEGLSLGEAEALLNKQSGLLGISGLTHDMRELLAEEREHRDRRASLAIDIFCYRVRKYVGAYLAAMGGADALVFAGGIGENAPEVRARICAGLEWMGLAIDAGRNDALAGGREGAFHAEGSRLGAWVIPTDEELLIARDTYRVVSGAPARF